MARVFDCAVCGRTIPAAALHVLIGVEVVCQACAGTRGAHALTWCPVGWHDGWDHGRPAADRRTAVAVLSQTTPPGGPPGAPHPPGAPACPRPPRAPAR